MLPDRRFTSQVLLVSILKHATFGFSFFFLIFLYSICAKPGSTFSSLLRMELTSFLLIGKIFLLQLLLLDNQTQLLQLEIRPRLTLVLVQGQLLRDLFFLPLKCTILICQYFRRCWCRIWSFSLPNVIITLEDEDWSIIEVCD